MHQCCRAGRGFGDVMNPFAAAMPEQGRNVLGGYLSQLGQFADEHIRAVQNLSTGLAVVGVVMFARSIRLFTKFTSAAEIPDRFIEKSVQLRGRIHQITRNGLEIEHIPITLPFISSLQRRWQSNGHLMVRLAGLQMTDEGRTWLREQIKPSQVVWFQPLRKENSFIDCVVRFKKGVFFSVSLNEEILRNGLGRTVNVEGLNSNPKLYWRLQTKLLKAELNALKKGKGIWKEPTLLERISNNLQEYKIWHDMHNLFSWVKSLRKKVR
ncbi:protein C3orf33 homolog isoform X2 [Scyliorhinus canicula]|uniref:protein C3orf33 homolog isoform X2 n=1 Tax=Scyliorhinus canicula TaxID=7830 RepID=UPI0018F4B676|nr:protein C3orf33 homolog isoform X2 [Scyliorhinus canicula]